MRPDVLAEPAGDQQVAPLKEAAPHNQIPPAGRPHRQSHSNGADNWLRSGLT
jgi:hypothetical protein